MDALHGNPAADRLRFSNSLMHNDLDRYLQFRQLASMQRVVTS